MSRDRDSRSHVELDVGVGQEPRRSTPRPDTPFNIAVLGDFRGRADGSVADGEDFRPWLVDRDNVDEVLARLAPVLRFRVRSDDRAAAGTRPESGSEITVRFGELEDFHPDRLLQRVPALNALWQLRKRLADPRTFAEAALELRGGNEVTAEALAPGPGRGGGASVLEDILAGMPGPALEPAAAPREDDLQALVRRLVAPYVVAGEDPRQAALVAQVDTVLVNSLRALLHQPAFQALEALWRGIAFLTRRLETDAILRVHLVDVSRATLSADVSPERETRMRFHRFATAGVDGAPWAVLAGCYTFGPGAQDAALLGHIARESRGAGVPWMAAADARLAGCPTLETLTEPGDWNEPVDPAWDAFRRTPEAAHVALALPRFLLRLPYGEDGEPCESLPFEEVTDAPAHDDFLWGNPAIACALLLGRSFERAGWQLRPGLDLDIDGLPLHLVRRAGTTDVLPCAESLMSERAAARLMEHGLMPLASLKDQDAVRLVRFQSMAKPATALAGGWSPPGG